MAARAIFARAPVPSLRWRVFTRRWASTARPGEPGNSSFNRKSRSVSQIGRTKVPREQVANALHAQACKKNSIAFWLSAQIARNQCFPCFFRIAQKTDSLKMMQLLDLYGGPNEDRTHDLCIANAALSHLSYRPDTFMILQSPAATFSHGGGYSRMFRPAQTNTSDLSQSLSLAGCQSQPKEHGWLSS